MNSKYNLQPGETESHEGRLNNYYETGTKKSLERITRFQHNQPKEMNRLLYGKLPAEEALEKS